MKQNETLTFSIDNFTESLRDTPEMRITVAELSGDKSNWGAVIDSTIKLGYASVQQFLEQNDIRYQLTKEKKGNEKLTYLKLMASQNGYNLKNSLDSFVTGNTDMAKGFAMMSINQAIADGMNNALNYANLNDIFAQIIPVPANETLKKIKYKSNGVNQGSATFRPIDWGQDTETYTITDDQKTIPIFSKGLVVQGTQLALSQLPLRQALLFFKRAGRNLANQIIQLAVDIMINGHDTSEAAGSINTLGASVAMKDIIRLEDMFNSDSNMSTILFSPGAFTDIRSLAEMLNPLAFKFISTGDPVTPLGQKIKKIQAIPGTVKEGMIGFDDQFTMILYMLNGLNFIDTGKKLENLMSQVAVVTSFGIEKTNDTGANMVLYP